MKANQIRLLPSKSLRLAFSFVVTRMNSSISQSHHLPPPNSDLCARALKDQKTFAAALAFSRSTGSLILGSQLHGQLTRSGFSSDTFSQNNLLAMYSKCGALDLAEQVFEEMHDRNLVSWTAMISGLIRENQHEKGLVLFVGMIMSGFIPNEFSLASVLSACAVICWIKFGCSLHSLALKLGLEANRFVGSTLVWMHAKWGDTEAAEKAFESVYDQDLACWNAMIEGYSLNGYIYNAIKFLSFILQKGLFPDQYTYISALKGCVVAEDLSCGRQIHCLAVRNEYEYDTIVMNSITDMYMRTGRKDSALKVFNRTRDKDNSSWNTVISGLAEEKDDRELVKLFTNKLLAGFKPDQITLSIMFRFCGATEDLLLGLQLCCFACHLGYLNYNLVVNSMINMFSRCGLMDSAVLLFATHPSKNLIMFNEMIAGYNLNGYGTEALQVFCSLIESQMEADEFTYSNILGACHGVQHQSTAEQFHARIIKLGLDSCCSICSSMINAYSSFGSTASCFKIFQGIGTLDLVAWGAMISAFVKLGFSKDGLSLLNRLRDSGEKPDETILSISLNACANLALLSQSTCIHSNIVKTGSENWLCITSAMIDAYAKCGDIVSSEKVFEDISKDRNDVIIFNTMITAYAHHGRILEAIELFKQMKCTNLYPTHATFVAVITACSHLGLVEQGKQFFDSISNVYGMHPSADSFACLVDLFARNGLIEEAKDVIEGMPFEPWPAIWISLLSGCRIYGKKEMAELAAGQALKLMPNSDSAYAVMANVYSGEGKWKDAERIRIKMEINTVQKACGYSVIST